MIPWFIVNIISAVASIFGRETYVTVNHGSWRWGADRIHFMPIIPGVPRPRKLAPYRGGPLTAAPCTCTTAAADAACPARALL
ncbi:hypothetical protein OMP43_22805 [Sphingomonas sp. CBMAI 2297]|uniref:hypothetical protein n=1 Tax=Sphingomonas sp. CBMAI 2297 TaxID=2991720 RepID=UPI002454F01C|nr:hypothetical protein [Sphingomonas sp. CBMAI 2297]MDH4746858.1 hypothetical protein [Sphingomonas sp. CBMAI 2297]